MKKKLIASVLAVLMVAGAMFALSGCQKTTVGKGESYGLVHGAGYVGAATVVADSTGKVHYVRIDEFMFPTNWALANKTNAGETKDNVTVAFGNFTTTKLFGTSNYAQYIQIGDKYFEATGTSAVVYKEINVTNGIADLMAYIKPTGATATSTLDSAALKWYSEAAYAGDCIILKAATESTANAKKIKDASNADIWVVYEAKAVGSSGGINKAFSSYGNATYDWVANTSAIEKFIYEHGTDFSLADMKKYKADGTEAKDADGNPITGESANKGYEAGTWKIGDSTTTVTAQDMPDYFMIAKKACEKALAAAK